MTHISAEQWGWGYSGRWLILKDGYPPFWGVYPPGECRAAATFPTFEDARAAFTAGGVG